MITGAYDVFNIKNVDPKFLEYYFLAVDNVKGLRPLYTGLRKVVAMDDFLQIGIPVPPGEEQAQIVRYLDWKVSSINSLINGKKKQIELLKEKKQAIINKAVTKGGEGWKKDKIIRLFHTIGSGTTPKSDNSNYFNGNIAWINSGDLKPRLLYETQKKVTEKAIRDSSALKMFDKDTIVIAMYGASIGNMSIAQIKFCCNQACCCLGNIDDRLLLDYAYYSLSSCKSKWIENSYGGGQPNISQDIIKQTWLCFPTIAEQQNIVTELDSKCSALDALTDKINTEISLLVEYRTSLVSDVVTGKIDVRGVAVPEFETVEEAVDREDDIIETEEDEQ
jgi:type I restriction enzyme S subunit